MKQFPVTYNNQQYQVIAHWVGKSIQYSIYLEDPVILELVVSKGFPEWEEIGKGNTPLAKELGILISKHENR